ncbi:uridine kinase [Luteococcus sp. Sow4_B9]|uniref:uridine kinase n=1 Tax=Luteococcus sp. Sow4_B9 TaxID=3438792 RepID=UPI003F9D7F76
MRSVILLAGPSGSGKSRLARVTGATQFRLDDFYKDHDAPGLPVIDDRIDWDDVATWDSVAAAVALGELLTTGRAEVPRYSIARSRAEGTHVVDLGDERVLIAEGIFAPDLLTACREREIAVTALWLDRSRHANCVRRLRRDLAQHRKPASILVRRGLQLWREETDKRNRALAQGFQPMGMRQAVALVRQLQDQSPQNSPATVNSPM